MTAPPAAACWAAVSSAVPQPDRRDWTEIGPTDRLGALPAFGGLVAQFGYRIVRRDGNAILAVDTRAVSKVRGVLLASFFGVLGLCFLLIAITSRNDALLGGVIFLVSEFCAIGTLYATRRVVVRNIVFTPDAMVVQGDDGRHSFDLVHIARFFSTGQTLMMAYGSETVPVMRRLPSPARIEAQVRRLLEEYRRHAASAA